MHTFTDEELRRQPAQMLEDAQRGVPALVTVNGQAVLMSVPLGKGVVSPEVLVELAARLFDSEQIGLGQAARMAGLSHSEMIDELGRRSIPVVRYAPDELERELEVLRGAAGR
jgi:predicted HTH domain antitoxin